MRYDGRELRTISRRNHKHLLKKRRLDFAQLHETAKMNPVFEEDKAFISADLVTWKSGDKFYKLALRYYGNMEDWWVIALFNNKPTDFHVKVGDRILVPYPPEAVKELYGI